MASVLTFAGQRLSFGTLYCMAVMTRDADSVLNEFCAEVARGNAVWALRHPTDAAVYSAGDGAESTLALWSSRDRANRYLDSRPDLSDFRPLQIDWPIFRRGWIGSIVPTASEIGVNWNASESACHATTDEVIAKVEGNAI